MLNGAAGTINTRKRHVYYEGGGQRFQAGSDVGGVDGSVHGMNDSNAFAHGDHAAAAGSGWTRM